MSQLLFLLELTVHRNVILALEAVPHDSTRAGARQSARAQQVHYLAC